MSWWYMLIALFEHMGECLITKGKISESKGKNEGKIFSYFGNISVGQTFIFCNLYAYECREIFCISNSINGHCTVVNNLKKERPTDLKQNSGTIQMPRSTGHNLIYRQSGTVDSSL